MDLMWQWIGFAAASGPIVWISRGSLRSRNAHGYYRFFAFEAILGLIALNSPAWFRDRLSLRQLGSWALLLGSALLAAHGFRLLVALGKPDPSVPDPSLLGVETTTRLVSSGAYRYIRHPLYASLLMLAWGALLKAPSWVGIALAAAATGALYLTARVEERENLRGFGAEYEQYVRGTQMFVPFVF